MMHLHKKAFYPLLGLLLFVVPLPATLAGLLESGFTATYEVVHKSFYLGDAVRSLHQQRDGKWVFKSDTQAKGLARLLVADVLNEQSTMHKSDNGFAPDQYHHNQHGGKKTKQFTLKFDWLEHQLHNDYTKQTYPLETATHDLLSFQVQLMHDLQKNLQQITYHIADKKRVSTYNLKVIQTTTIETPFKTMSVLELNSNIDSKQLQFRIWCAPVLNYLPVRVESTDADGNKTELSLKSIRF